MIFHSKVDRSGRTALPADLREAMGARPGTTLVWEIHDGWALVRVQAEGKSLGGALKGGEGRDKMMGKVVRLRDALLSEDDRSSRYAGMELRKIGPHAEILVPGLVNELFTAARDPTRKHLLFTAAYLAPDRRDIFDIVVHCITSRGSYRRPAEHPPDDGEWMRANALETLGVFSVFVVEAMPVLVASLETFEEYDGDWGYLRGEHGRIVASIRNLLGIGEKDFAPIEINPVAMKALIPLLPVVAAKICDTEGEPDGNIIRLLGQIGPAAMEVLPRLRELDPAFRIPVGQPNPEAEPLEYAIFRITHGPTGG